MIYKKKNRLFRILLPLSCVLAVFSIFLILWLRSGVVSLEYNISALEQKRTELLRERKTLGAARANLLSAGRFENVAARGFIFPDRVKVVHVRRGDENDVRKIALSRKENSEISSQ